MKDKKKLILSIILSIVAVAVFIGAYLMINNNYESDKDGQITVVLVELDGTTAMEKTIDFKEGDTLQQLIEQNFNNVVIENGMIMSIETFTTPSDWSTFISIYVNDEMSMVGLAEIQFTNGTKISFIMTEFVYE